MCAAADGLYATPHVAAATLIASLILATFYSRRLLSARNPSAGMHNLAQVVALLQAQTTTIAELNKRVGAFELRRNEEAEEAATPRLMPTPLPPLLMPVN